jgi:hypothetical protein
VTRPGGKLGNADPRGTRTTRSGRRREGDKAAREMSMGAGDERCIGNGRKDGGMDEDIDLEGRQAPLNKSGGG